MLPLLIAIALHAEETPQSPSPAGVRFFEQKIRPVLLKHCYSCHSAEAKKSRGGLLVDSRAALLKGGDAGPAVVPGKPLESLLLKAIRHDGLMMPPKDRLSAEVVADFEAWIKMGAPDPRDGKAATSVAGIDLAAGKQFWSFRPPVHVPVPAVKDSDWPRGDLDRFVLAALERQSIRPVRDAEAMVWLRRVTFDLTGLPPSAEEIASFESDTRPDARERVVDRLLASSAFGERWGRHWLDVARYADSNGKDENLTFHEAYLYRDYIIEAFNGDRSFADLVREQVAGDLLPYLNPVQRERQLIGSGFLVIGPKVLADRDQVRRKLDVVDEQIDTIGRTFLGLSLGCARCHDHKFDPIPTSDYYALAGIFTSTRTLDGFKLGNPVVSGWSLRPMSPEDDKRQTAFKSHEASLKKLTDQLTKAKTELKSAEERSTMRMPSRLAGIVVDDVEAKQVGEWKASVFTKPFVGKGYIHDDRTGDGKKSVLFTPKLPNAGIYEVFMAYTPGASRASNVPVTVKHAGGEKTVTLDQTKKPGLDGLFSSIGTYRFDKDATISITNKGTNGHVIVDAVRLIPIGETPKVVATAAPMGIPPEVKEQIAKAKKRVAELEADVAKMKATAPPAARLVMAPRDEDKAADLRIHIRGSHQTLGTTVPRGTLQVASWGESLKITSGSGRRELGEWLADARNPLTARVFVNRVWSHLFGEGIVRSVDNFGTQGEAPTHPELLDRLALDFIESGWSVKGLVRRLTLSRTYALAVAHDGRAASADPENRLLWRAYRRRLEAEPIRDAVLTVAGTLDRRIGGSVVRELPERAITNESQGGIETEGHTRRSVYLPVIRNGLPGIFEVFDFADPDVATGKRDVTTVPTQALYLLNSRFVIAQARKAADRLLAIEDQAARVRHLYRSALGRSPTEPETQSARRFVAEFQADLGGKPESEREAWAALVQAVFGCTEFRFVE